MKGNFCFMLCLVAMLSFFAFSGEITNSSADTEFNFAPIFTNNMVLQRGKEVNVYGYGQEGKTVTVTFAGQTKETTVSGGKWSVKLSALDTSNEGRILKAVSGGKEISVSNVVVGEVWLAAGQSNMEMSLAYNGTTGYTNYTNLSNVRIIDVPNGTSATLKENFVQPTTWKHTKNLNDLQANSAYALGFALKVQQELGNVPVGVITADFGGSAIEEWMDAESVGKTGSIAETMGKNAVERFNQMINPIGTYTVGGFLWYQGSTNAHRPDLYIEQFKCLVEKYREIFSYMPIVSQQLQGYNSDIWPEFRQMQWDLMESISDLYVVNGIDTGLKDDIHPRDKYLLSSRAAELALTKVYGLSGYKGFSPYPKRATSVDGQVTVAFNDIVGEIDNRTPEGEDLVGFEVAGSDGKYYPAKASVVGETVVLSSDKVPQPASVRYAWEAFPTIYLYSSDDNPFAPFEFNVVNEHVKFIVNCGKGGSINAKTGWVVKNSIKDFEVSVENGYNLKFVTINGDEVTVNSNKFSVLAKENTTIDIVFEKLPVYNVTSSVTGGEGYVTVSAKNVYENGQVKVYVVPEKGYSIKEVTVNGKTVSAENVIVIDNIEEDIIINAKFKKDSGCSGVLSQNTVAAILFGMIALILYKKLNREEIPNEKM